MIQIKNKDKLVENGKTIQTRKARTIVLRTFEHTLDAVDAGKLLKSKVKLEDYILHAGTYSFDLRKFRQLLGLGGGKASGSMALALEKPNMKPAIPPPNAEAMVVRSPRHKNPQNEASHPIP